MSFNTPSLYEEDWCESLVEGASQHQPKSPNHPLLEHPFNLAFHARDEDREEYDDEEEEGKVSNLEAHDIHVTSRVLNQNGLGPPPFEGSHFWQI